MEALRQMIESPAPAGAPSTLAGVLQSAAVRHPAAGIAWLAPDGREIQGLKYPELLTASCEILGGLQARLPQPGSRIVLLLERPEDFLPAFWATILGGYLPCPLALPSNDPQRKARQISHLDRLLEGPLFVGTESQLAGMSGVRSVALTQLRVAFPADPTPSFRPEDPALLMLTSGSTGSSKAVILTHANLLSSMAAKVQRQEFTAQDRTLNWVSFDHVAALLEGHLLPLYAGAGQLHVMPSDVLTDPLLLLRLIDRTLISQTFTPNFLLGHLNAELRHLRAQSTPLALDLSSLRRIICGGEAVMVQTGKELLSLLAPCGLSPDALWPAFGMTETCAGSVYSREFPTVDRDTEVASLGLPVPQLKMRIVDGEGRVLPANQTGELQLQGPMVFGGYYRNEEATRAAFTEDGWFRTGDLGYLEHGRLRLIGRAKDSIIVSGVSYFAHEIETAVGEIEGIERGFVAAFPHRPAGADTEQLVIAFAPTAFGPPGALSALVSAVRDRTVLLWGFRPTIVLALSKTDFPKTSLGKTLRSLMRQRFEAGDLTPLPLVELPVSQRSLPQGETERSIAEIFERIFGQAPMATDSFLDLGGTSIQILRLKKALERRFGIPDLSLMTLLQQPTVRALATCVAGRLPADRAHDPLVSLQLTGIKTPLFCVHPGSGEVLVFVHLAARFAGERPFHALRARGLSPGEAPYASFQEMVEAYTAAIRSCQPHGPYALAGYSFGAGVAFEIARTLERQGEQVPFLASIDGPAFLTEGTAPMDEIECTVILAFFLGLIDRGQLKELAQWLRTHTTVEEVYLRILELARPERILQLDLTQEKLRTWARLSHHLVRLGESYSPSGNVERITVFHAQPLMGRQGDWLSRLKAWERFSRVPSRYIEVSGEHHTLLDPAHVPSLHAALRAELECALL